MAKLPDTMVAPEQVIVFLLRSRLEFGAQLMISGDERLTTIKRLGRNFSGMIDPHESCGFASFGSRKPRVRIFGRCILMSRHVGRLGPGPCCHYPEGRIEFFNATIEKAIHGENYMRSLPY